MVDAITQRVVIENVHRDKYRGGYGGGNKVENSSELCAGRNRNTPLSGNGYLGGSHRHAGDELVASQPERPRNI